MALLNYRSTPCLGVAWFSWTLHGKTNQVICPQINNLLAPTWTYIPEFSRRIVISKRNKRGTMIGDSEFVICLTFLMTREFGFNLKLRLFREELVLQLTHQYHTLLKHQLEICGGIVTISALFLPHMKWKITRSVNQGKQVNRPSTHWLEESWHSHKQEQSLILLPDFKGEMWHDIMYIY